MAQGSDVQPIVEAMIEGLHKHEVKDIYDRIGRNGAYDREFLSQHSYNGPKQTAEMFNALWPHDVAHEQARILDVGAGTGLCGEALKNLGFRNVDALEPSQGMTEVSKQRGVYRGYYLEYLEPGVCTIPSDSYDGVISSGAFGPSHIPCSGINEIIRVCKPGGLVCLGLRGAYLDDVHEYRDNWFKTFQDLETQGDVSQIQTKSTDKWYQDFSGVIYAFKVLRKSATS